MLFLDLSLIFYVTLNKIPYVAGLDVILSFLETKKTKTNYVEMVFTCY